MTIRLDQAVRTREQLRTGYVAIALVLVLPFVSPILTGADGPSPGLTESAVVVLYGIAVITVLGLQVVMAHSTSRLKAWSEAVAMMETSPEGE